MSATVIPFPPRGPFAVIVERAGPAWLVIVRQHGWLHGDRRKAIAEAREIARGFGVGVFTTGATTMTEYDNTNRGALFKNDRKEKDDDRDYGGIINIDGREYWLSGWKKTAAKTGATFLSLSVKPKTESPAGKKPAAF
jgi:hypothetical protein